MPRVYFGALALIVAITVALWLTFGTEGARQRDPALDAAVPAGAAAPVAVPPPPAAPATPRQTVENKVLASGRTIRVIRRARIALPTGRMVDDYTRLAPEAQSGNALSQYRLGLLLYECRDVPADAGTLDREVEAIHQTRRHGGWDVSAPKSEESILRSRYEECEGIPVEARLKFRDWLKSAADAGVIEAEINLPLKLPPAEYCQFLSECSPEQRASQEALQKEALDYLGRARDAGSVSALWTFGAWYAEGEVLPKNDIEAYAHFRALDQINAVTGESQRFEKLLADMKKRLRPIDLDQAETRANELLSNPNCCVITP
ncbi:MAG: hypothetical protein NVS9B10_06190 [Nevskia sp.]